MSLILRNPGACRGTIIISVALLILGGMSLDVTAADLYLNVLAVNGTDKIKEDEIRFVLPQELGIKDVLDTSGLNLDYDVNEEAYYVHDNIELAPKETKTYKVKIRDVWKINQKDIDGIKNQIDTSLNQLKDTEYFSFAKGKKDNLIERLDFIQSEQEKFAHDIEQRIDRFRVYSGELKEIRDKSISVKFWRSKPPVASELKSFTYVVELRNPSKDKERTMAQKHYLPAEVMPEHIADLKGFNIRYDPLKKQSYLSKEEKLAPAEVKRYDIDIIDVWNIPQTHIDNLKERTRDAYNLLKNTQYAQTAEFLVASIKNKLAQIEASQKIKRNIQEHISAFRVNHEKYELAEEDVDTLEELLIVAREELERSKLKNVLQQVKSLRTITEVAKSIFKRPQVNTAWKMIMGIVIFVGLLTFIHFVIWGKRSKAAKIQAIEDEQAKSEGEK